MSGVAHTAERSHVAARFFVLLIAPFVLFELGRQGLDRREVRQRPLGGTL